MWSHADGEAGLDLKVRPLFERLALDLGNLGQERLGHVGDGFAAEVLEESGEAVAALEALGFTVPTEVFQSLRIGPVAFQIAQFFGVMDLITLRGAGGGGGKGAGVAGIAREQFGAPVVLGLIAALRHEREGLGGGIGRFQIHEQRAQLVV